MISPQYTPFTDNEVRRALNIPLSAYVEAVSTGTLRRSVHFDCRVSGATGLHSLVDVVRYDALFGGTYENPDIVDDEKDCDWWLDGLCGLFETTEDSEQLTANSDIFLLMMRLSPAGETVPISEELITWTAEWAIFFDVVNSWCRCYRALNEILMADA